MKNPYSKISILLFLVLYLIYPELIKAQATAEFHFDGNIKNEIQSSIDGKVVGDLEFGDGLEGKSLKFSSGNSGGFVSIKSEELRFNNQQDFSVQFWIKTDLADDKKTIVLSSKKVADNSLASQKQAGWSLLVYNGTLAWNVGSGTRRLNYQRDNGTRLPLNDGKWHLLALTFNTSKQEFRLYYDGTNTAIYKVGSSDGFNFNSENPLVIGWNGKPDKSAPEILPNIEKGTKKLQELVDVFNELGIGEVESEEFVSLIVDPKDLFNEKVTERKKGLGSDSIPFLEEMKDIDLESLMTKRSVLMKNPYTVYQVRNFMIVAPLLQIYSLHNGKISVNQESARRYTREEQLHEPDFELDNLKIWNRELLPAEVENSYAEYFKTKIAKPAHRKETLVSAVWNIWHGGKHNTIEKDGFDSRMRIVEMLKKQNADVIMMQETYSSGDFIAAELGYYFATTADWDYLNQGSNISVLSRYPIKEVYVPEDASFMNVAAKVAISKTQDLHVMSNWYGMNQFPVVFDFHKSRFDETDKIPVLFGGDFNAVPHTDGGKSPASKKMLEAGFTDAFRSLHPDVEKYPGFSHRGGFRIDQLYHKGKGLKNTETKVISTWETGFPSDHYLIISKFELN